VREFAAVRSGLLFAFKLSKNISGQLLIGIPENSDFFRKWALALAPERKYLGPTPFRFGPRRTFLSVP